MCFLVAKHWFSDHKMVNGMRTSRSLTASTVIDGLLDSGNENDATGDSSDIVEAGMDDGEFDEVSSSSDNDSFSGNSEGEECVDDSVVLGPSSRLHFARPSYTKEIVNESDVSETSESSDSSSEVSDDEDGSRPNKCAKKDMKRMKKWPGKWFAPKPLMAFDASGVGMQAPYKLPVDAKEVEYFRIFFDGELVSDIKNHTNAYADELIAKGTKTKTLAGWVRTTTNEIYSFLAIIILMGVVVKKSIKDYWSYRPIMKTLFWSF